MDIDRTQKTIKALFLGKCWEYLNQNFHKFKESHRIKIALTLCQKDMPTQLEGGLNVVAMPDIKISGQTHTANFAAIENAIEATVEGEVDSSTSDTGYTGEADTDNHAG